RAGIDPGDEHALNRIPDLILFARLRVEARQFQPQGFLHHGLVLGRGVLLGVDRRNLFVVLEPAHSDFERLLFAFADDDDIDLFADRRIGDDAGQVTHFLDGVAVERDDHIARLDAGRLGRALVVDTGHQRATRLADTEAFGEFIRHFLNAHPEPPAPRFAVFLQLIEHRDRAVGRNRETDADRAAGRRDDCRVDADDLAVEIEQRAAGIAAVDGRVGLDVVVVRPGLD